MGGTSSQGVVKARPFDLDGTLTRSGGAGSRALGRALHARPQAVAELHKMRLDGMTDRAIARSLLAAGGDQAGTLEERVRGGGGAEIDAGLERYLPALSIACAPPTHQPLPRAAG